MAVNTGEGVDILETDSKIVCTSCKRLVKTELKCVSCDKQYHPACLVRMKGARVLGYNSVSCPGCSQVADNNKAAEVLARENDLLNRLILTMMENQELLRDKLSNMEDQFDRVTAELDVLKKNVDGDGLPRSVLVPPVTLPVETLSSQVSRGAVLTSDFNPERKKTERAGDRVARRTVIAPTIQNASAEQDRNEGDADHQGGFRLQRRQKRQYRRRVGNADVSPEDEASGFAGGERRAWIYLNRVRRHTTQDMVLDYIKGKPGFENEAITVRELPSDPNQLKCFVVIAPFHRKDELYEPNFWPRLVGIKRFDFSKHRDFLQGAGNFL